MTLLLGILFVGAGVCHFLFSGFYVGIMPTYLPWQQSLVYLSGVAEIVLGIAVLIPRLRYAAAWGLIALLVAIFPANIHMAINSDLFPIAPPVVLWLRLPLQGAFMTWAYWIRNSHS